MTEPTATGKLETAITSDLEHLRGLLKKVDHTPALWRLNGCGTTLLGQLQPTHHADGFFTRLFVTVLWVPIIPLGIYLVSYSLDPHGRPRYNSFLFHAQIAPSDFHRVYHTAVFRFYLGALGHALAMIGVVIGAVALVVWLSTLLGARRF
jgi:hypothetical protein